MRILLLGKGGQVGWELQRSLSVLGQVMALDFDTTEVDGVPVCGDFSQPERVAQTVRDLKPDVIVNAAAHTAVDKAQSEPDVARLLNATTPGLVAQEAKKLGAWLMHYSTDYVFDGSGTTPWVETDAPSPLNVYGHTKLEGEQAIVQSGCQHIILRTSWVYGARGGNFAKTMLKLAQEREELKVINDQVGAPTGADLLADVTAHIIARCRANAAAHARLNTHANGGASADPQTFSGIYHCAAAGQTTWFDYANHVLSSAVAINPAIKIRAKVLPVPTSAFPTPAQRPHNSRLNSTKLQHTFGLNLPHWQAGVSRMLTEFLDKS
jgi:dTDP-4-dehydrorhamnose reductase